MTQTNEAPEANAAPTFDFALGIQAEPLTRALGKIHQQLYPSYFTGKNTFEQAGAKFDVSWDVKTAPRIDLTPVKVTGLRALIEERFPPENNLLLGSVGNLGSLADDPEMTVVRVVFPLIGLKIESAGVEAPTTAAATAYIQITTKNYRIEFKPIKAEATTPKPDDQWVLNKVVIPQALKIAAALMSAITIPEIRLPDGQILWPLAVLHEGYLVILANAPQNHYPLGIDAPLPRGPQVFLAVSGRYIANRVVIETRERHDSYYREGSAGPAHFDARINVDQIKIESFGRPTEYPASANITGEARGWLDFVIFDLGLMRFKIRTEPRPHGVVKLEISRDNTIKAGLSRVDYFNIFLIPDGNIIEEIMGAVFGPLMSMIMSYTPIIRDFLMGVRFDLWKIPEIPVAFDKVHFTIRLVQMQLVDLGPSAVMSGNVELT